jgi:hypothetical protein
MTSIPGVGGTAVVLVAKAVAIDRFVSAAVVTLREARAYRKPVA